MTDSRETETNRKPICAENDCSRGFARRNKVEVGETVTPPQSPTEDECARLDAEAERIANMSDEEILANMTPEDHVKAQQLKQRMLKMVKDSLYVLRIEGLAW